MTCWNRVLAVLASVAVASAATAIGVAEEGLPKPAKRNSGASGHVTASGKEAIHFAIKDVRTLCAGLRKSNRRTLLWQAVPADSC